jgi:putative heme-binding domain-containing protein
MPVQNISMPSRSFATPARLGVAATAAATTGAVWVVALGAVARLTSVPGAPAKRKPSSFVSVNEACRASAGGSGDPKQGQVLFKIACAACHQVGGQGNIVGPQLDGIGGRGAERLIEDILDPNRNVDVAFRAESLVLRNGDLITGLVRSDEGNSLLLADAAGKAVRVQKSDICFRSASVRRLMPDNFHEAIPAEAFHHLLAYLISLRAK